MSDFLAMGGYGLYVWGSYGVTLAALALELISLRARRRRVMDDLRRTRSVSGGNGR